MIKIGPTTMKIYATLLDDVAEGFVWLKKDGIPPRCVVKITNKDNGRSVWCEALQFDTNFLNGYNRSQGTVEIDNPESSMVMSYWYRAKLGSPEAPLETQKEYALDVGDANSVLGKLRASISHPQLVVRVAAWLSLLSVLLAIALGVPGLVLGVCSYRASRGTTTATYNPSPSALSLEGVLAWRGSYGDLLGKPRDTVIERFGAPQEEDGVSLSWNESPKTGSRTLMVFFDSVNKDGVAKGVKVGAHAAEWLDPMEVLKRAPMFDFSTGTYNDSLLNYLVASTKDGRNSFQFDVTERGLKFRCVVFIKK